MCRDIGAENLCKLVLNGEPSQGGLEETVNKYKERDSDLRLNSAYGNAASAFTPSSIAWEKS